MKILKIKLTKLKELPDALHKFNIEEGFTTTELVLKEAFVEPTVGFRFYLGVFSTSGVQEVLTKDTFRTYSSIYKWEILSEEDINVFVKEYQPKKKRKSKK